jgi:hypothetical protein
MSNARTLASTINSSSQIVVPCGGIAFTDLDSSNDAATGNEDYVMGQDGYEEGFWAGTLKDAASGGNQSSSTANGNYVKIGSLCFVNFQIDNILVGSCSGVIYIHGLPFYSSGFSFGNYYTYRTGGGTLHHSVVSIPNGNTFLRFNEHTGTSGDVDNYLTWADIVNNTSAIYLSLVYKV